MKKESLPVRMREICSRSKYSREGFKSCAPPAGTLSALKTCVSALRRRGIIRIVGVYGTTYDNFPLGQIFDKMINVKMGLVRENKVCLDDIITHKLSLARAAEACDLFCNKEDNCMKVILNPH
jgi:S-(hydroxymethyl)glutathione dehydrogenase / alcohol dehydrogenase